MYVCFLCIQISFHVPAWCAVQHAVTRCNAAIRCNTLHATHFLFAYLHGALCSMCVASIWLCGKTWIHVKIIYVAYECVMSHKSEWLRGGTCIRVQTSLFSNNWRHVTYIVMSRMNMSCHVRMIDFAEGPVYMWKRISSQINAACHIGMNETCRMWMRDVTIEGGHMSNMNE